MSHDLLGHPINWGTMHPREAATSLYALGDREQVGSAERARLYGLAGHYATKARTEAARRAAAEERRAARVAVDLERIRNATWSVPA